MPGQYGDTTVEAITFNEAQLGAKLGHITDNLTGIVYRQVDLSLKVLLAECHRRLGQQKIAYGGTGADI